MATISGAATHVLRITISIPDGESINLEVPPGTLALEHKYRHVWELASAKHSEICQSSCSHRKWALEPSIWVSDDVGSGFAGPCFELDEKIGAHPAGQSALSVGRAHALRHFLLRMAALRPETRSPPQHVVSLEHGVFYVRGTGAQESVPSLSRESRWEDASKTVGAMWVSSVPTAVSILKQAVRVSVIETPSDLAALRIAHACVDVGDSAPCTALRRSQWPLEVRTHCDDDALAMGKFLLLDFSDLLGAMLPDTSYENVLRNIICAAYEEFLDSHEMTQYHHRARGAKHLPIAQLLPALLDMIEIDAVIVNGIDKVLDYELALSWLNGPARSSRIQELQTLLKSAVLEPLCASEHGPTLLARTIFIGRNIWPFISQIARDAQNLTGALRGIHGVTLEAYNVIVERLIAFCADGPSLDLDDLIRCLHPVCRATSSSDPSLLSVEYDLVILSKAVDRVLAKPDNPTSTPTPIPRPARLELDIPVQIAIARLIESSVNSDSMVALQRLCAGDEVTCNATTSAFDLPAPSMNVEQTADVLVSELYNSGLLVCTAVDSDGQLSVRTASEDRSILEAVLSKIGWFNKVLLNIFAKYDRETLLEHLDEVLYTELRAMYSSVDPRELPMTERQFQNDLVRFLRRLLVALGYKRVHFVQQEVPIRVQFIDVAMDRGIVDIIAVDVARMRVTLIELKLISLASIVRYMHKLGTRKLSLAKLREQRTKLQAMHPLQGCVPGSSTSQDGLVEQLENIAGEYFFKKKDGTRITKTARVPVVMENATDQVNGYMGGIQKYGIHSPNFVRLTGGTTIFERIVVVAVGCAKFCVKRLGQVSLSGHYLLTGVSHLSADDLDAFLRITRECDVKFTPGIPPTHC